MTALPPTSDLVTTGISKGTFKGALTNMRAFLAGLLGTSGTQAAALAALGVPMNATVAKSGAYTVVASDRGKVFNCSGTWELAIDAAATLGDGFVFGVYKGSTGTITVNPNLSEQIDGATTKALPKGLTLIQCDGTRFFCVGAMDSAAIIAALGFTPADSTHNHTGTYAPMTAIVAIADRPSQQQTCLCTRANGTTFYLNVADPYSGGSG